MVLLPGSIGVMVKPLKTFISLLVEPNVNRFWALLVLLKRPSSSQTAHFHVGRVTRVSRGFPAEFRGFLINHPLNYPGGASGPRSLVNVSPGLGHSSILDGSVGFPGSIFRFSRRKQWLKDCGWLRKYPFRTTED